MLCIALTLTFGARAAVTVSESVHHEVEVTQAASPTVAIICLGDDRSCGLPEHDENQVIPHVHAADNGFPAHYRRPLPECHPIAVRRRRARELVHL